MKKAKFEDFIDVIDVEIAKRRNKWNLTSLTWMDYDDVAQMIRFHIWKKWEQYDQSKPIQPWLNVIISHQIKNLIRNIYSNYARPCLKCQASIEPDGCEIWGKQCTACPLYKRWVERKQPATNIKIPVSMENHMNEVKSIFDENTDVFRHVKAIHAKMKQVLKPVEWQVYEGLFIQGLEEEEVAKKLGYITNELGRKPRYKQIRNIRKAIMVKVKASLRNGDVDII